VLGSPRLKLAAKGWAPMKVLGRLFTSKPQKELIACLDELQSLFAERQGRDFAWLAFDDIRSRAKAYFLENPDLSPKR
jgi:hypothetical protein